MTDQVVASDFTFFGMRKPLAIGEYKGMIKDFFTTARVSKNNVKYNTLTAKVEIDGEQQLLNLSLNPKEEGKSLNKLIKQLALFKPEKEIIDMCVVPKDFFEFAKNKPVKMVVTNEKGYLDVWPSSEAPIEINKPSSQDVDPNSVPDFL